VSPEKAFGAVLRTIRASRGLSQESLGFESGYHRTYVSLLERGLKSPSLRSVFKIAKALDVRPSDLIARVESFVEAGSRRR
jgi:transcriptional regulator with XRE-family HTH domain